MNQKQMDPKVNEYIARNVRIVEVGVLDRTCVYFRDGRYYEMCGAGSQTVELASAPVSGPVCKEALRRMNIMMQTQRRMHGIVLMYFEDGKVTYTRTSMGEEWRAA